MLTYLNLTQYGRFGNQCFFIASTIGIALKFGYKYAFPEWKESQYFVKHLPLLDKYSFKNVPKLPTIEVPFSYKNYTQFPDNVNLFGFMQTEKYFKHCEKLIREYFEMKPITGLPKIEENSIAIHFRGGDFGSEKFPRTPIDYYLRALELLPSDCKLYFFSDEVETAKKMFESVISTPRSRSHYFIETNDYIKDFYLMRQCKHFIIPTSSFSWWAAWLGKHPEKIVIAPKNWYAAPLGIVNNDIYCEGWKII